MKKIGIVLFLAGLLAACGGEVPRGVIPPEKMKLLMWDLLKADELASETVGYSSFGKARDSMCEILYQKVFLIHKTDKETFARSLKFYQGNPDISKKMLDSVISYGEREKNRLIDTVVPELTDTLTPVDTTLTPVIDTTQKLEKVKMDSLAADSLRKRAKMLRDSMFLRRHKLNTKATK